MWRLRLILGFVKSDNKLFMQKRKEQMFAAQNVWEMEDYSKKYSMIEKLLKAMFPVSIVKLFCFYLSIVCRC